MFTLSLNATAVTPVTVTYTTADGTATGAGADYIPVTNVATIAAGAQSVPIQVQVLGDTAVEPDETFFVNLSSPVNATIADGQAVATILNDDSETNPDPTIPIQIPIPTQIPVPGRVRGLGRRR